jgi:hypothetical protein
MAEFPGKNRFSNFGIVQLHFPDALRKEGLSDFQIFVCFNIPPFI